MVSIFCRNDLIYPHRDRTLKDISPVSLLMLQYDTCKMSSLSLFVDGTDVLIIKDIRPNSRVGEIIDISGVTELLEGIL